MVEVTIIILMQSYAGKKDFSSFLVFDSFEAFDNVLLLLAYITNILLL